MEMTNFPPNRKPPHTRYKYNNPLGGQWTVTVSERPTNTCVASKVDSAHMFCV